MGQLGLIRQAPLTIILIVLCVALYIPDLLGMNLSNYMAVGAATFSAEPWTLVTAMFAHGSLMHLFFNMISLFYMGSLLESLQGTPKFALLYFASGIAGNAAFVMFASGYAVGASGAIFGLMGAFVVLMLSMRKNAGARSMLGGLAGMIAINVINSFTPGIALEAHFGGLAVGAIIEMIFIFVASGRSKAKQAQAQSVYGAQSVQPTYDAQSAQAVPEGYASTPTGSSPAVDIYDATVNRKRMEKRSRLLAIIIALALTGAAFGAMAMTYLGVDFSEARVIGSDAPRTFSADESAQWAGDEFAGLVQIPSSWAAEHTDTIQNSYSYSYAPVDGELASLTVRFDSGSFRDAAAKIEGTAEDVEIGGFDAVKVTNTVDENNVVSYFIDRSSIMQEGSEAYTMLAYDFAGEQPAWVEESIATFATGMPSGDGAGWVPAKPVGSSVLGQQKSQWAGDEKYGYVQLPDGWVRSVDTSTGNMEYEMILSGSISASDGAFSYVILEFVDMPTTWNNMMDSINQSYDNATFDHVVINGVDAHTAIISSVDGDSALNEYICYMNNGNSTEDAFMLYFAQQGSDPVDFESILATYIPSKL